MTSSLQMPSLGTPAAFSLQLVPLARQINIPKHLGHEDDDRHC